MNKETIDYTSYKSEEFWATAPEGYDYYIVGINNGDQVEPDFHRLSGDQTKYYDNDECFWPKENEGISYVVHQRPATFTKPIQQNSVSNNNWDGTGVPVPGEMVEAFQPLYEEWHVVKVLDSQENGTIAVRDSKDKLWWTYEFRPIKKEPTIQEKILDKWKAQALEFAYDTKDSKYPVGSVIDFIVNNYDVKELVK